MIAFESTSPEQTQGIARALAGLVRAGDCLALEGPLGAGKTCFAQGLARGLGIDAVVSSPSFVLAKQYPGDPGMLHVDAYRLGSPMEFWDLGLAEQIDDSVTLVEWAGNVAEALPEDRLKLAIERVSDEARVLRFEGRSERWRDILSALAEMLTGAPATETQA